MFSLSSSVRIFLCTKPADMRKSFDGLCALAKSHFNEDPYSGCLFIFRSSRGDYIKILWFDIDGFAIFAKRLELGTFRFPDVRFVDGKYEPVRMERADLLMLLEGIDTDSVKRLKRYRQPNRDQKVETTPKVFAKTAKG
jgi:transposase